MIDPALAQKLKLLTLCVVGLLLAVFLGTQIGEAKYWPLLLGTVFVAVASVSLFSGGFFWVLTIASSFLGGTFPILGGSFTPFQILMAIGVAKFVTTDVVLRRTRVQRPARFDMLLMAGFMAVMTWHGVHDRFGMKFLGSSVWGGRNYINVYVGLAAFFIIQSVPTKPKLWAKLPYVVLAVTTFDVIIAVITTISYSLAYKIYPFYSAISTSSIEEITTGSAGETGRIGAFGNLGFILILLVLASISLRQLLSLENLSRFFTFIAGSIAVLYSGFRSAVFNTSLAILSAGIRDLKWGVLVLAPIIAILLFGLSFINSEVVTLPRQVQRGLAFVPGKWDALMARDAASSNQFRELVWTTWTREYFPVHPWLGRGFGFNSRWGEISVYKNDPYATIQVIETGNIHNGFLASLDTFGIVGTICFVIWNLRLLGQALQVPFRRKHPEDMALRFVALYLAVAIASYWIGAQHVGTFLPQQFALAGVFLRLRKTLEPESIRTPSSTPTLDHRLPLKPARA
jgi:O-antigen ligase